MISILDHENRQIAEKMQRVFQDSYAVEARLLGAKYFPPLKRKVDNIMESHTSFFGYSQNENLVAIVEIEPLKSSFHICSLVVDPNYFRRGIAKELISFIFKLLENNTITVETGLANKPAIELYRSFGFQEVKQYDTDHGIRKIRFQLENA